MINTRARALQIANCATQRDCVRPMNESADRFGLFGACFGAGAGQFGARSKVHSTVGITAPSEPFQRLLQ